MLTFTLRGRPTVAARVLVALVGRPVDQIAAGMDGWGRMSPDTPPWLLDQLLTAEQGLHAVTLDAAWALGDEARRGHLAPGASGDVTILSGDVIGATADEIRDFEVIATTAGGSGGPLRGCQHLSLQIEPLGCLRTLQSDRAQMGRDKDQARRNRCTQHWWNRRSEATARPSIPSLA